MIVSDGFTDSVRGTSDGVADEEPLDLVRLAVAVDHRSSRVVAHAATALDVGRRDARPADLSRARGFEDLSTGLQHRVESLDLVRLEVDVEALALRSRRRPRPSCCRRSRGRAGRPSGGTSPPPRPAAAPTGAPARRTASSQRRSGPGSWSPRSRSRRPRRAGTSCSGRSPGRPCARPAARRRARRPGAPGATRGAARRWGCRRRCAPAAAAC